MVIATRSKRQIQFHTQPSLVELAQWLWAGEYYMLCRHVVMHTILQQAFPRKGSNTLGNYSCSPSSPHRGVSFERNEECESILPFTMGHYSSLYDYIIHMALIATCMCPACPTNLLVPHLILEILTCKACF